MITITDHKFDQDKQLARLLSKQWNNREIFSEALPNLIVSLCKEKPSDYSAAVLDAIKDKDYDRLLSEEPLSPNEYLTSELYRSDAQIYALIKKYPHWDVGTNPKLEAMKTFIACELKCRKTNSEIFAGSLKSDRTTAAILASAQRKIASILGIAPSVEELSFKFGPGSAFSVKNNTSALDKLESQLDVTTNCYVIAEEYLQSCPGWRSNSGFTSTLNLVPGDRLSFVPKTAKTDRPIGINGLLNSLIQKSIGSAIKEKLRPVINLRNAQEKHRNLARQSSVSGRYATIDLRSASDTISYALVLDLLPPEWFSLLDQTRSPCYTIEGKTYDYHKFSAMGNGYTFELETLIFWAISDSCRDYLNIKGSVSVYGDDIIVPTQCAALVIEQLQKCGFDTNVEKTFLSGQFRESCGGDYFDGIDVRPFYMKDYVTYRTLFLLHNYWARNGLNFVYPKTFRKIRRLIGKQYCSIFKSSNPEGDGHLYDPSIPGRSYFTVSTVKAGRKRSADRSQFSKAYALYRLQFWQPYWVAGNYIGRLYEPPTDIYERKTFKKSRLRYHRYI